MRARRSLAGAVVSGALALAGAAATTLACTGDTFTSAADAAPDVNGSGSDAGVEASGGEGGDGGGCAPAFVDAGAPTFCASRISGMCADFDESADAASGAFEATRTRGDFSLVVTSCGTYAGAGSLVAHTGLEGPDGFAAGLLRHTTSSVAATATLQLAARVDLADDGSPVRTAGSFASVEFGSAGVNLIVDSQTQALIAGVYGGGGNAAIPGAVEVRLPRGRWVLVTLVVAVNETSPATVSLYADYGNGGKAPVYTNAPVPDGPWSSTFAVPATPTVMVGSFYSVAHGQGWTFALDDVTFEAQ